MHLEIEPTPEQLKILLRMARRAVADQEAWEAVYGSATRSEISLSEIEDLRKSYTTLTQRRQRLDNADAYLLKDIGWPVYTKAIRGSAPNTVSHYNIDNRIQEIFGCQVSADSEQGGLFIDVTEEVAEAAYSLVCTLGGGGPVYRFSGDREKASYCLYDIDSDLIGVYGLGSWSLCKRFLETYDEL